MKLLSMPATMSGCAMNGDLEAVREHGEQQPRGSTSAESMSAAAAVAQEQRATNDNPDAVAH